MKRIMISQPMRGKTNELIKEERKVLVQEFKDKGYEVLDTVFDEAPKNIDEAIWFLSKSIEYLAQADIIYFIISYKGSVLGTLPNFFLNSNKPNCINSLYEIFSYLLQ